MYVYKIVNPKSEKFYIGITNNLKRRMQAHKYVAKSGSKSPLYDWIRSHNMGFTVIVLQECSSREEAEKLEQELILVCREAGLPILNVADGGDGGFVITDVESWKQRLKVARKGKVPAKGMKHSDENKQLFAEVSNAYWESQDTYTKNINEILKLSHKEAKEKFGISTTHYYRLRKRLEGSASSEYM